ncbi:MAG: hypothetical protein WDM86_00405 [Rhizomicrobium sp.]
MNDTLTTVELLRVIERANSPEAVVPTIENLLVGQIVIYEPRHGSLRIDAIFKAMWAALPPEKKFAALEAATNFAFLFLNRTQIDVRSEATTTRNIFRLTKPIFADTPKVFRPAIELARALLTQDDLSHDVDTNLAAAQVLVDTRTLGTDKNFWIALPTKAKQSQSRFIPTVVVALLAKWPDSGLAFLLTYSMQVTGRALTDIERFATFYAVQAATSLTQQGYSEAIKEFYEHLSEGMKAAVERMGSERGWPVETQKYVPPPQLLSSLFIPTSDVAKYSSENLDSYFVDVPVSRAAWEAASDKGSPQPLIDLSTDSPYLKYFAWFTERAVEDGHFADAAEAQRRQLEYVRAIAKSDIERWEERDPFNPSEKLLAAISKYGRINDYAGEVTKALRECGFREKPVYFLHSEYHQDRLLMHLAVAALRGFQFHNAETASRRWDATTFKTRDRQLSDETIDGHVMMTADLVERPSPRGIYKYVGFRVFGRVDVLRELLTDGSDKELHSLGRQLLEIVDRGGDPLRDMSLTDRAKLTLKLGTVGSKGTVFESVRPAVERLAAIPPKKGRSANTTNDESLMKFVTGEAGVYCGGAINARLMENWYLKQQRTNFVELIPHRELETGLGDGRRKMFIENGLRFDHLSSNKTQARRAETAITRLMRSLGDALQRWAQDVCSAPQLNGRSQSCDAARRLLKPANNYLEGRFAFATTLRDPAALLSSSDQFYSVE